LYSNGRAGEKEKGIMKRVWGRLPGFVRWTLVTVTILAIAASGAAAYTALTMTGEVSITESLSWVGDPSFTVQLYPQEETVQSATIANASATGITIDVLSTVDPDPGNDVTVDLPNSVTIPGSSSTSFDITISASKSVPPVSFTITLNVDR
jgi:hypothetical protein